MVLKRHQTLHTINMAIAIDTAINTNITMDMGMVTEKISHPKHLLGDDVFHK